ncbi:hypothetical protein XENOCAPTIV_006807, partial [Xenoophorus captivus]
KIFVQVIAALQLGQDPANDCPDSQRTVRTVIQKRGINEAMLGLEYRNRKITIQNNWLTVLFIIIGALLLIMLFCICCCQCCPQKCCCYIRCPCCPRTCFPASMSDYPTKQNISMTPMHLAPMAPQQQQPPLHTQYMVNGSLRSSIQGANPMLDYLENQVRGLDVVPPQIAPHTVRNKPHLQPQPSPPAVPYAPGPPSMLSALNEMGVKGMERRVITLPPIIQHVPSFSSRRDHAGGDRARGYPRMSSQSSGSTNHSGGGPQRDGHGYKSRDDPLPRQGILREYSADLDWDNRRGRATPRGSRNERGNSAGRRGRGSRPRIRSRDDIMEELHSRTARRERSYSPPRLRKGSWSSDEEVSSRRTRRKGKDWPEKPPSYYSTEVQPSRSNYDRLSVRSSPTTDTEPAKC